MCLAEVKMLIDVGFMRHVSSPKGLGTVVLGVQLPRNPTTAARFWPHLAIVLGTRLHCDQYLLGLSQTQKKIKISVTQRVYHICVNSHTCEPA